jgi:large conductance mechanosensitive channel
VFKEFKEFISRGNVIDLAVAVVVGVAFQRVIDAIVKGLLTPLIGMAGDFDFSRWHWTVRDSTFEFGAVVNEAIAFLSVAVAIFIFVIKPMNMLAKRRARGEEPVKPEEVSEEVALLAEIRDLLRQSPGPRLSPGPRQSPGPQPEPRP